MPDHATGHRCDENLRKGAKEEDGERDVIYILVMLVYLSIYKSNNPAISLPIYLSIIYLPTVIYVDLSICLS